MNCPTAQGKRQGLDDRSRSEITDTEVEEHGFRLNGILCVSTGISVPVEMEQPETYQLDFPSLPDPLAVTSPLEFCTAPSPFGRQLLEASDYVVPTLGPALPERNPAAR